MFKLSRGMREELRIPFGEVFVGKKSLLNYLRKNRIRKIITVGDACSRMLAKSGFVPKMLVIDEKIRRKRAEWKTRLDAVEFGARSRAGTISNELSDLIRKISKKKFSKPVMVFVRGEEDLAVLPVVKFFPVGYVVIYGLFTKSVLLKINGTSKKRIERLLRRMRE